MKKLPIFVLLMTAVLMSISGCSITTQNKYTESMPETPNTMPPSIYVNGSVYTSTGEDLPIEVDPSIIQKVTHVIPGTELPSEEGTINFPLDNGSYALITDTEEYVVVSMDQEWQKFTKRGDYIPTPGKYLMNDARIPGGTWIYLRPDGTFVFMRDLATSYVPQGTYRISADELILDVSKEEYYIFKIEGDTLLLKDGTHIKELVPINSLFLRNEVEHLIEGAPMNFTEKEIRNGMSLIEETFSFPGATLKKLWYEEEKSTALRDSYMKYGRGKINGIRPENVLVILSEFTTDETEENSVLNPNSTYTDYQWILIRSSKDESWRIDDQGY
ncbi:DUF4829 domain-containing protein [Proteiniclasticum ruminis]|uniref:DUF4829 domain-containing protein n=1 Tax=Proteiniclasticum ruminis TaxID=398199 RepID=A0A1I4Y3R8_9CLOT|nr:DUF4829 domain-containing protein [Proteiniclasticum ruminis]SFN32169.1 protein of unknown function [Proteiniclasticum ruminis]